MNAYGVSTSTSTAPLIVELGTDEGERSTSLHDRFTHGERAPLPFE